jgi:hypothetical protein
MSEGIETALSEDSQNKPVDTKREAERQEKLFSTDPKNHQEYLEFKRYKLDQKNEKSERKLREENAGRAFWFSFGWAIFIGLIIFMHAMCPAFTLTETEFLAVIGTMTLSILVYYLLVVKYLFYRKPSK